MAVYKQLNIVGNASESFQVGGENAAVKVVTSGSATVKVQTSIDNVNFNDIEGVELTVDGTRTFNLCDMIAGQFLKVTASGGLINVSILG